MPKINAAGESLIKDYEGLRLVAYPDPASGSEPYTIGFGHTGSLAAIGIERDVRPDDTITQEQAEELLQNDLRSFEVGVNNLCAIPLTSNQFSALVSFAYNEGLGALATSTLMRLVNAGNFKEAALQFSAWTWAGGGVMPGLVTRRAAEAALFSER